MRKPTTVPRAKVEALAASIRELRDLEGCKAGTQAQLIRWCVWALKQTTDQAQRSLERERRNHPNPHRRNVRMHEPAKKVREDRALAMLHLEWLATQLEDQEKRQVT